ncbi:hypothetical protein OL239_15220 [Arthrobacter sp. ATA002]|uniref:hypothetical protein n=1 Tax=Arthrobacter sp. ATA002 TaxID=2991715 RepID=UPI0022A6CA89|nr:hypothetical protein [Arthrobacter sp. ATA002]WAP51203.1 hypothetical protein OL239_15220 [Arthrobacter sp. ATA002]
MSTGPTLRVILGPGDDGARSLPAGAGRQRPFHRRRRNRHGRGLRGELIPAHLAGSRSRSERFDAWVLESAQRLERLWGEDIQTYQFVVQDIPPGLEELAASGGHLPFGAGAPAAGPGRR